MTLEMSSASNSWWKMVTDRRMLEEQLRQAQRLDALGQLAGGVAHDFNNILSVITVGAQLGMRRLGEGNPLRERFSEIKQAADRAAELTRQLLAFSRKQIVEPTVVNINWLISGMSTMLGRLISADIELSSELDETLGNVLADKGTTGADHGKPGRERTGCDAQRRAAHHTDADDGRQRSASSEGTPDSRRRPWVQFVPTRIVNTSSVFGFRGPL